VYDLSQCYKAERAAQMGGSMPERTLKSSMQNGIKRKPTKKEYKWKVAFQLYPTLFISGNCACIIIKAASVSDGMFQTSAKLKWINQKIN
jgi:hypothetical protein